MFPIRILQPRRDAVAFPRSVPGDGAGAALRQQQVIALVDEAGQITQIVAGQTALYGGPVGAVGQKDGLMIGVGDFQHLHRRGRQQVTALQLLDNAVLQRAPKVTDQIERRVLVVQAVGVHAGIGKGPGFLHIHVHVIALAAFLRHAAKAMDIFGQNV